MSQDGGIKHRLFWRRMRQIPAVHAIISIMKVRRERKFGEEYQTKQAEEYTMLTAPSKTKPQLILVSYFLGYDGTEVIMNAGQQFYFKIKLAFHLPGNKLNKSK